MKIEANENYEALIESFSRRKLGSCELNFIQNSAHCDRAKNFLRIWCLKESYVKALGTGLASHKLNELSFRCSSELTHEKPVFDSTLECSSLNTGNWHFTECLHDDYIFTCCTSAPLSLYTKDSLKFIEPSEIIEHVVPLAPSSDSSSHYFVDQFFKKSWIIISILHLTQMENS